MQIIITYCVCYDVVRNLEILEDMQVKISMADGFNNGNNNRGLSNNLCK